MKTSKNCTFKSIEKDSETISGIDNPSNSKYVEWTFAENAGLDVWQVAKRKSKIGNLSSQGSNVSFWHMSFQVP